MINYHYIIINLAFCVENHQSINYWSRELKTEVLISLMDKKLFNSLFITFIDVSEDFNIYQFFRFNNLRRKYKPTSFL